MVVTRRHVSYSYIMSETYTVQLTWSQWITWRRGNLDMTKEALAQVITYMGYDITRQTIWRLETGRNSPGTNTKRAVEDALTACEEGVAAAVASKVAA